MNNACVFRQAGKALVIIVLFHSVLVTPCVEQSLAIGDQFQVNIDSAWGQTEPDVGVDDAGNFIVVWNNASQSIVFRRYDSGGNAVSTETSAHSGTAPFMVQGPSVATANDGDFVVAWAEYYNGGFRIGARIFAADGTGQTDDFVIDSGSAGYGYRPEVASDANGNFVVVWDYFGELSAKVFDSTGTATSSVFAVNAVTTGTQDGQDVAMDADGDIVVTWLDAGGAVKFRRFASTGTAAGGEYSVSSGTVGAPKVDTAATGEFVVVWREYGSAYDTGFFIYGQRFSATGNPTSAKLKVNVAGSGEDQPSVSLQDDGEFMVVWQTGSPSGGEIDLGEFDNAFTALTGDEQVNTYSTSVQSLPVVKGANDGYFAVAWVSDGSPGSDVDSTSVQARFYRPSTIFDDGFESADTSQWSATVGY